MTNSSLKAADLTRQKFLELVGNIGPRNAAGPRRIWLEAADGWAFDWWLGLDCDLTWCGASREPVAEKTYDCLSRSISGRLFAPDGELRWRIIPALGNTNWRTTFLGDGDWADTEMEDHSDHLHGLERKQERYILWGQQTADTHGEWIELRIPHRFRYPVEGNPRQVMAVVEQWRDGVGEPHFLRLSNLEPLQETFDA